jgi:hypothetical protein
MQFTKEETKNLPKTALASKVVNPFTRALAPPFIGRWRDLYILKMPSNLRNIPSVNMYMNVFYILWFTELISYIYKFATSSHVEPGLLRQRLWLELLPIPEFHRLPILEFRRFMFPELRRFMIPELRRFIIPELRRFMIPVFRGFQSSWSG